jgi:hypothetical protein
MKKKQIPSRDTIRDANTAHRRPQTARPFGFAQDEPGSG